MSSPCVVRIELVYEDGSKRIAIGRSARILHEWLNEWYEGPVVEFHPAVLEVGGESQGDVGTEVRGR
jgi:hypothetical protein